MLELLSFYISLIFSSIAAAFDVKITPTEIPDEIPHAMIAIALILAFIKCLFDLSLVALLESLLYGLALLAFGFLMYKIGQWGGGDAKLLAAIGFFSPLISPLVKNLHFPFALSYLLNVFVVGAAYMIAYAIILGFINKSIFNNFKKNLKSSSRLLLFSLSLLFLVFSFSNLFLFSFFSFPINLNSIFLNSLLLVIVTTSLILLWFFVKTVEEVAFKRKIPVSKLKVGDVLMESKVWEGITEEELKKIKKSGKKFVWIKEGVRFAPTFPLALLSTVLFGDLIFHIFSFFT
ncbi:MAG: prepilin peptidase [Candidatus Aenigmatarchaeota archaeon]